MTTIYIYALADPGEPSVVRYIGQSAEPERRLMSHMNECAEPNQSARARWLRTLKAIGKHPLVTILDAIDWVGGMNPANDLERVWIARYAPARRLVNTWMNPYQEPVPEGELTVSGAPNLRYLKRQQALRRSIEAAS